LRPDGAGAAVTADEGAVLGAVEGGKPTDFTSAADAGRAVVTAPLVPTGVVGNDAADPLAPLPRRPPPVLVRS
jgi:hypothetical protein